MQSDEQTYAGCNHILEPGVCHISLANPSFKLIDTDGKWWWVEWHHYFGPSAMSKRDPSEPLRNQPGEKSRFWLLASWWHRQGCKVVDGVGQWTEPPKVRRRCVKLGPSCYQLLGEKELLLGEECTVEFYEDDVQTIQVVDAMAVNLCKEVQQERTAR